MRLFFVLFIVSCSLIVQAQSELAVSFTGSYNIANKNIKDNFNNGFGGSTEFYYSFDDSPFSVSLSFSLVNFAATDEYLEAYKNAQQNLFPFDYSIHYFSVPVLGSVNYRFLRKKKLQPFLGIGAGLYTLVHKVKQTGNYSSDTQKDFSYKFGVYPHAGLIYDVSNGVGILFKAGYNQTFGDGNSSYTDIRLGIIYKI